MKLLEVYRLAYEALLVRYEKECCQPLGPIRKHRIAELDKKIAELHQELLVLKKQEPRITGEEADRQNMEILAKW